MRMQWSKLRWKRKHRSRFAVDRVAKSQPINDQIVPYNVLRLGDSHRFDIKEHTVVTHIASVSQSLGEVSEP